MAALETTLQFTQKEHEEIKDRVATCENEQIRPGNELTRQGIYGRRWNLPFFKINETKDENCHHLVKDILTTALKLRKSMSTTFHYAEYKKKRLNAKQPRPIIVRFACPADSDHAWYQHRHLEGSNVRMVEDLSFHVPALNKAKMVANVKASTVGDKLVVNGRRYTFYKIPMQ